MNVKNIFWRAGIELKSGQAFVQFSGTANFLYATACNFGMHVITGNKNYLLTSIMDYELAKERFKGKIIPVAKRQQAVEWLKKKGVNEILLPSESSYAAAAKFEREGFKVSFIPNPFSKAREIKTGREITIIRKTCSITIKAFKLALRLLKARRVKHASQLKEKLENYLYSRGYLCEDLIAESGKFSALPHSTGKGRIEEHVVIDIFPKCRKTNYHADFTRTVLLERNGELEDMLLACIEAKNRAIKTVRHGTKASEVYSAICDVLEERGFGTLRKNCREGFIHAAGHGIGLEIHEAPSLSEESEEVLQKGMVLTVEPGLYYRKIGGVRVEDAVLVRKNGAEVLTPFEDYVRIDS